MDTNNSNRILIINGCDIRKYIQLKNSISFKEIQRGLKSIGIDVKDEKIQLIDSDKDNTVSILHFIKDELRNPTFHYLN